MSAWDAVTITDGANAKAAPRIPTAAQHRATPAVQEAYDTFIIDMRHAGGRYDAMVTATMALARYEERGYDGATSYLEAMRAQYVGAVADRATTAEATKEYDRALIGARQVAAGTPAKIATRAELAAARVAEQAAAARAVEDMVRGFRKNKTSPDTGVVEEPAPWPDAEPEPEPDASNVHEIRPTSSPDNPYLAALVDWGEFLSRPIQPLETWDDLGIMTKGRHSAVVARGGAGKSLVMYEAVFQAARNGATILYVDFEMSEMDVRERCAAFGVDAEFLTGKVHYAHLPIAGGLDTLQGAQLLIKAAVELAVDLVIVDTLTRAVDGPENDADTVRALYARFSLPMRVAGIDIVRLDHLGKDETLGARGTSAKDDDVDQVWQLTAVKGKAAIDLKLTKNRANSKVQELHFKRVTRPTLHHKAVDRSVCPAFDEDLVQAMHDLDLPIGLSTTDARPYARQRKLSFQNKDFGPAFAEYKRQVLDLASEKARPSRPQSDIDLADETDETDR